MAKPSPAPLKAGSVVHPAAHPRAVHRPYKPKSSRGRPTRPVNRNMSLNNQRRPYQSVQALRQHLNLFITRSLRSRKVSNKRLKYLDKPCPRFTTTGTFPSPTPCQPQPKSATVATIAAVSRFLCYRHLQPRFDLSVPTRTGQDRDMLEVPTRQLPKHRCDVQSLARSHPRAHATLCPFRKQWSVHSRRVFVPPCSCRSAGGRVSRLRRARLLRAGA